MTQVNTLSYYLASRQFDTAWHQLGRESQPRTNQSGLWRAPLWLMVLTVRIPVPAVTSLRDDCGTVM